MGSSSSGNHGQVQAPTYFLLSNSYIECIVVFAVHAILVIRLYGIYGSKRFLCMISTLHFLASAAELYMVIARGPTYVAIDLPGLGDICVPLNIKELSVVW